jgi:HEAT repeat protein
MDDKINLFNYINQLTQKNLRQRREAIRSVVDILKEGDVLALDPLIDALCDDDLYIRIKAAKGLGIIRDKRGIEPLTNSLKDLSANVRVEAAKALERLGDHKSIYPNGNSINKNTIMRQCASLQISMKNHNAIEIARNKDGILDMYSRSQNENNIQDKRSMISSNALYEHDTTVEVQCSNQARSLKKPCQIFIDAKVNAQIDMGKFYYLGIYYPKNILEKHNRFSTLTPPYLGNKLCYLTSL